MVFFALTLLALTFAFPLNLTFSEAFPANVTLPESPPTPDLTAGRRCEFFEQGDFLVEDCFAAVQALYIDHVITDPDKVYEFRSWGTPPKTENPWMQLPIVYTVNTCSLTVLPLKNFGPKVLPGGEFKPWADYDTATFKSLWQAARALEEDCLLSSDMAGWIPAGDHKYLGIFLYPQGLWILSSNQNSTSLSGHLGNASSLTFVSGPSELDTSTS